MFKFVNHLLNFMLSIVLAAAGCMVWLNWQLPDTFSVPQGKELRLAQIPWLVPLQQENPKAVQLIPAGQSYNVTLSVLGKVPVKTVRAVVVDRRTVTVCGTPFGIKMFSEGAMIVGFSDVRTENGFENPAKQAGLKMGDSVLKMNGRSIHGNDDLALAIQGSKGEAIYTDFLRNGEKRSTVLHAVKEEGKKQWKVGMWVRDSSAGIGTLTFVDNKTGVYGGLGHPISDSDTGESINLRTGEIAPVTIFGCDRGTSGTPGELKGKFVLAPSMGNITVNGPSGVYGQIKVLLKGVDMAVAQTQEVQQGAASIITTIDGNAPQRYEAEIERISMGEKDLNRNMVIRITDPVLKNMTGGIVQGMSGSPIVQNGRLVGAVTHVFVNDPTRGYGIFIENMLKTADSAAA